MKISLIDDIMSPGRKLAAIIAKLGNGGDLPPTGAGVIPKPKTPLKPAMAKAS